MAIGSIPTGINATAQYLQQAQGTGQAAEAAKITANAQNRQDLAVKAMNESGAGIRSLPLATSGPVGTRINVAV